VCRHGSPAADLVSRSKRARCARPRTFGRDHRWCGLADARRRRLVALGPASIRKLDDALEDGHIDGKFSGPQAHEGAGPETAAHIPGAPRACGAHRRCGDARRAFEPATREGTGGATATLVAERLSRDDAGRDPRASEHHGPHAAADLHLIALLANNFDVRWVMRQVGHADSKMTMDVYAQLQQRGAVTRGGIRRTRTARA
jgi:integrase